MIKHTLERMGVVHDEYFNEHSLYTSGKIAATLADIAARGLSYEKDGAVWFKATAFGAEKDRVLVKATGEPTYRLPDIAYHRDKFARGYDQLINVFGADHLTTYPDVLACLKALDYDTSRVVVLIHQFVTIVRDGHVVKMSTRKANYITLDELMDEVGVDATRYFFVMRRLGSHFEFDLELAKKQSLDNPVFYVQYAHARICSALRHCAELKPHLRIEALTAHTVDSSLLRTAEEQELIRHLAQCNEMLRQTAATCEPHRVTLYAETLAELFHRYYNQHQIVTEDDALARARVALAVVTGRVLRTVLGVLGVTAPERM
jgi:arginyl-tRNA synthetase